MSKDNHFPLPPQVLGINIDNIINPLGRIKSEIEEEFYYRRKLSQEVQLIQAQYLIAENEFLSTLDYVYPSHQHTAVFSPTYANIIKSACNLFEVVCRKIYLQIYRMNLKEIDIYNFLTLDKLLDFKSIQIECPLLEHEFPKSTSKILKPYDELQWDKLSSITYTMIPKWWTAHNKIKHDINQYSTWATFENAIRSLAACACLIYRVYGAGVTMGKTQWYISVDGEKRYSTVNMRSSALFYNDDGASYKVYE